MAVDWDWERVVFDHVRINVRSAEASIRFYETVLGVLRIPPLWKDERGAQFANLVVIEGDPGGPVHVAFVADSREQVDAFHAAGIEAGFADNGPPASGSSTAPRRAAATTPPFCSIRTATTSRPCGASSRPRARAGRRPSRGGGSGARSPSRDEHRPPGRGTPL